MTSSPPFYIGLASRPWLEALERRSLVNTYRFDEEFFCIQVIVVLSIGLR
jgi:hypothetical protein